MIIALFVEGRLTARAGSAPHIDRLGNHVQLLSANLAMALAHSVKQRGETLLNIILLEEAKALHQALGIG